MSVASSAADRLREHPAVAQATLVAAAGDLPEFCQLQGSIAARSAGADAIRFQINLPTRWNEKALMVGGGGFNGTLINATAALRDAAPGQPLPLTAREIGAALLHGGIQTAVLAQNHFLSLRGIQGSPQVVLGGVFIAPL